MRGQVFGAALTVGNLLGGQAAEAAPQTYPVVAIGDSIGRIVFPLLGENVWYDADSGRQPNFPGIENRGNTVEALAAAIPHSEPSGWVIVQDGGSASLDTDPAQPGPQTIGVTDEQWRDFTRRVIELVPDDRCLLMVLPGYDAGLNPGGHDEAWRRSRIIEEEIPAQPCYSTVAWNQIVDDNPDLLEDGLHPNTEGAAVFASAIQQAMSSSNTHR